MTPARQLTTDQAAVARFVHHGLLMPFSDPVSAAGALCGAQAQILPAAGLALWNRVPAMTVTDLDRLLYQDRSLTRLWGQRHTLHLYPATDWPIIYAAQSQRATYWEQEALRDGWDPAAYEAFLTKVAQHLFERETMGRSDLKTLLPSIDERHLSGWGGVFAILARRGLVCHAAPRGGEARMAHRLRWLPDLPWDPPSADEANLTMLRRYLATCGPATIADMSYWRGCAQAEVKRWLTLLGDEIAPVSVDGQPAWWLQSALERVNELPSRAELPARLLGRFDPLLLSTRAKSWLIDADVYHQVWRPAGHIEATILIHGRIAGTWRYDWQGAALVVTMRPFTPLEPALRDQLERLALGVANHFNAPLGDCRWEE
ncbi:winged helix DNA-binding domain-containing protein [Chloroflexus sp.]|uniref:winged helix DNA-binding domain-containing protein n=1 Tax=Chloroflexus sp. TaxID=1904827 RepID=UPI002613E50B|nr:winged helix DNA-binding domain-containing protein [uncultured Chloroflexus sp.]